MAVAAQSMSERLEATGSTQRIEQVNEQGPSLVGRALRALRALHMFAPQNAELRNLSERSAADIGMQAYTARLNREFPSQRVYDHIW